jgi:hypothetical protein
MNDSATTGEAAQISALRASALAFLAAGVTLFVQVLVHRMVSAKLLNNYAFLVISLTMLGFALSGVILTRALPGILANVEDAMTGSAVLFTLSFVGASALFYHARAGVYAVLSRPDFVAELFRTIPLALVYALPFLFAGLILGTVIGAPGLPTRTVYCFDLLGASLGALVVIPAISRLGVERAGLVSCLVLLLGTCLILPPRGRLARLGALVAVLLVLGSFTQLDRIFFMRYPEGSILSEAQKPGSPYQVEYVAWDPLARIEVTRVPTPRLDNTQYPCLLGDDPAFLKRFELMLSQNNYAFTYGVHYGGERDQLKGVSRTIYSAAYQATSVPSPRVLVIGVGGGFDVLNALYFNATKVTAVEINAATVDLLTTTYHDYFRAWVDDPRVKLVNAEGRSYLTTSPEQYDVIQLSGVDSYSGTPGAAHVFSENYLYTQEAFDLYLSRLSDQGILNLMRLEHRPAMEMLRALTTAVTSLRHLGIQNVWEHIAVISSRERNFTALLVKRVPFGAEEMSRLKAWTDASPFFDLAAPLAVPQQPNAYQVFLALREPGAEAVFMNRYPFDIHPVDDDRPFFFRFSYWWHLFPSDPVVWMKAPALEYSLTVLFILVAVAAFFCVYLPLWLMGSPRLWAEKRWRYALYCGAIALGYLAIEMAFLQKFALLLGHPNYALSVVLSSLLLATGVGSLLSPRLIRAFGNVRTLSYALASLILLEWAVFFPRLPGLMTRSFALRVALVFALIAPVGLVLGAFVPTVLETLKEKAPAFVPWAWGINGIFSVLAPILSIGFSTTWGVNALFIAAIPVYLLAALALP